MEYIKKRGGKEKKWDTINRLGRVVDNHKKLLNLSSIENHYFLVRKVGLNLNYNCSYNAATTSQTGILRDGRELVSGDSSAMLQLRPVNESIHGTVSLQLLRNSSKMAAGDMSTSQWLSQIRSNNHE